MNPSRPSLEPIFANHIQTLALTLWPATVQGYRSTAHRFLAYLRTAFPQLHELSQLRRDPHLLSWFRSLCEQPSPLSNQTRIHHLVRLRRLLDDLAANGHSLLPDLIRRQDFPPPPTIFPDLSPSTRTNSCSRNCAAAMISPRMRCCSSAAQESASANASISLWTACGR